MLGPHVVSQPLKPGASELQGFFLCTMNFLRKKTSPKCSVDKGSTRKKKNDDGVVRHQSKTRVMVAPRDAEGVEQG